MKKKIGVVFPTDHFMSDARNAIDGYEFVKVSLKGRGVKNLTDEEFKENVELLDSYEILYGACQYFAPYIYHLRNVKWIQNFWAGIDSVCEYIDLSKPPPCFKLTRFGGFFGQHMSEYVISNMINFERKRFHFHDLQKENKWGKPAISQELPSYRLLSHLSMFILGAGLIGKDIAHKCQVFGMTVYGLCTKIPEKLPEGFDALITRSQLEEYLQKSDYVCNVLPSTPNTKNMLSDDVLKNCEKRKSVFVNVGRGDVIDEKSLISAIRNGWLGGAILDVFHEEPLPKDSMLWSLENVLITPHISAVSIPKEVSQCFKENLELYHNNKPLKYEISWERMY